MSHKPLGLNYYTELSTLENGEKANKSTFNRPLVQLAENIQFIKNKIDSATNDYDARYEPKIKEKKTGYNLDVATDDDISNGAIHGKLARADDPRFLMETGAPKFHEHSIKDILPDELVDNTFVFVSGGKFISKLPSVAWNSIADKPNYFPTTVDRVTGLRELLYNYSSAGHTHGINDIRNLDNELTVIKNNVSSLNNQANSYAPKSHTHDISDLRAPTSPNGYILYVEGNLIKTKAPPDPNATLPLNGLENQFVKFSGGKVLWDNIKVENVLGLQKALDSKAPLSHRHSITALDVPEGSSGKFLFVDANGNVSLISGPGEGGFTPDEFIATIDINLESSASNTYIVDIPNTRLFGVSVKTAGPVKNLQVELLGMAESDIQYLAVFTDTLTEDVAQGWRFRDRTGTGKMRVRVTNKAKEAFSGAVKITAEPF